MLPTQMQYPASCKAPSLDDLRKGSPAAGREEAAVAAAAVDVCLAAVSLAGAALLTWWALAFHPSYAQLWMVPVGLVLGCTPVVVCAALHFSGSRAPGSGGTGAPTQPLSAVVVDK